MSRYSESHADPKGPGDSRPTALQIVEIERLRGEFSGKVAVVTGGTAGIGLEMCKALHAAGMHLVLGVLSEEDGKSAVDGLGIQSGNGTGDAGVEWMLLDNADLRSVRAFADSVKEKHKQIHLAVYNAGVMLPSRLTTDDGYEGHFQINYLGHFLLTQLLLPVLTAAASEAEPARIVTTSSCGHGNAQIDMGDLQGNNAEYDQMARYGISKLETLWHALEVDRRYKAHNVRAFAVHPGTIFTALAANLPEMFKDAINNTPEIYNTVKSIEQGAATSVWAALSGDLNGQGGLYLEDCTVAKENLQYKDDPDAPFLEGYAEWAYDTEGARRLWEMSEEMVAAQLPAA